MPELAQIFSGDALCGRISEILSHNLFIYCANSPAMFIDPDGHVWVYGVYAPDYGAFHRAVQEWIVAHNPNIKSEVVTSTGRIDLYNTVTHEMYEVKPDKPEAIAAGKLQLDRYKEGTLPTVYGKSNLVLPPDGAIRYDYPNTTVTITVRQIQSIIVYIPKVIRKSNVKTPITVPRKEKEPSPNYSYSPKPNWALVIFGYLLSALIPGPADDALIAAALLA